MKPSEYKKVRQSIGTMGEVAEMLGISKATISRREAGLIPITKEAEIAINHTARWEPGQIVEAKSTKRAK